MAKTMLQSNTIRGNLLILAGAGAGMYFGVIPPAAAVTAGSAALFNIYQRFNTNTGIISKDEKDIEKLKAALGKITGLAERGQSPDVTLGDTNSVK